MISHKIQKIHQKIVCDPSPNFITILFRGGLYLLSLVYLSVSNLLNLLYKYKIKKTYKLSRPVISIGNISAGGTGKTPLCMELLHICIKVNKMPALVSRGYGNDESLVYQKNFPRIPMAFSADRIKACSDLLHHHPEIDLFILDDGYQHQKVFRNLNILLLNASNPFGLNYCLPRGFLRESIKEIVRADLVIITHADEVSQIEKENIKSTVYKYAKENIPIFEATHEPSHFISFDGKEVSINEIESLKDKKMGVLCGIADPQGFVNTLKKCNVTPSCNYFYPDHHQYLDSDFQNLEKTKHLFDCLLTTEKDIVKINKEVQKNLNIFTLKMSLKLSHTEQLTKMINELKQ